MEGWIESKGAVAVKDGGMDGSKEKRIGWMDRIRRKQRMEKESRCLAVKDS